MAAENLPPIDNHAAPAKPEGDAAPAKPEKGFLSPLERSRRQLIKSSIASVPLVLTVTAGRAQAQPGSVTYSPEPTSQSLTPDEDAIDPLFENDSSGLQYDHSLEESLENGGLGDAFGEDALNIRQ